MKLLLINIMGKIRKQAYICHCTKVKIIKHENLTNLIKSVSCEKFCSHRMCAWRRIDFE